ncbi:MAG: phosphoglycerate kinase [Candidatus Magasanikbacteria bacterium]|nr:phosphoglycerate kinase [Candidatus Magasanikbacteria bacterium]
MFEKLISVKNLKNKIVLVRVDFNVPLKKGKVVDDSRIEASLPTINYLRKQKARVVLMAHLGRPKGKFAKEFSLKPVAELLGKKIKQAVKLVDLGNGEVEPKKFANAKKEIEKMRVGQIIMLENTRFLAGEESNDANLSQVLASLADIFVFDGFAVAHRAAASVSGVVKYLPTYAGLLMASEVENLTKIMAKPKRPFVAVVGGAKMETKVPVLKSLVKVADQILVAGGIVNTILAALGYGIGDSICDKEFFATAKSIVKNKKIILPVDVIVGDTSGNNWRVVEVGTKKHEICGKGELIADIGPATNALFASKLMKAKSALWNGALGWFEQSPYGEGTYALAEALASATKRGAFTVAGGGETVEVLFAKKLNKKISFISTGGGAMLEFISGKKLPGVKIL